MTRCAAFIAAVLLVGCAGSAGTQSALAPVQTQAPGAAHSHERSFRSVPAPAVSPSPFGFYVNGRTGTSYSFFQLFTVTPTNGHVTFIYNSSYSGYDDGALAVGGHTLFELANGGSSGGGGPIVEYTLGNSNPVRQFVDYQATRLAADSADTLYVADASPSGSHISVYPAGATSPSRQITKGITNPTVLAIGPGDRLYVSNGSNIMEYARNGSSPIRVISYGIRGVVAMAWDKLQNLLVLNSASVTIYPKGSMLPTVTITNGISGPASVAVGPTGTVYVANYPAKTVTEYDHEQPTLSRTITLRSAGKPHGPILLHVDENDTLYELIRASSPNVKIFPSQQTEPSKHIGGFDRAFEMNVATEGNAW